MAVMPFSLNSLHTSGNTWGSLQDVGQLVLMQNLRGTCRKTRTMKSLWYPGRGGIWRRVWVGVLTLSFPISVTLVMLLHLSEPYFTCKMRMAQRIVVKLHEKIYRERCMVEIRCTNF